MGACSGPESSPADPGLGGAWAREGPGAVSVGLDGEGGLVSTLATQGVAGSDASRECCDDGDTPRALAECVSTMDDPICQCNAIWMI